MACVLDNGGVSMVKFSSVLFYGCIEECFVPEREKYLWANVRMREREGKIEAK